MVPRSDDSRLRSTYRARVHVVRSIRPYADLALALVLAAVLQAECWSASYTHHRPLLSPLLLLTSLPLALRCRYPLPVFVASLAGLGVIPFVSRQFDNNSIAFVVVFFVALYSAGAHTRGWQARIAAALVALEVGLFVVNDGDSFHVGDVVFGLFIVGGPWAAGVAIRTRRQSERHLTIRAAKLEREQEERARAAVAEERARIARELHDVVAHAISVTVVQARGGRRVLDEDRDEARAAFDAIERTSTQALGEMRRLLGMLRESDAQLALAPQPSLARLHALAEQVRAAGLPVEVDVEGDPVELPPGVDLSAYRIVQEALTNALKHAGPARARVRVRYSADELELEITDDGAGAEDGADSGGHGLVGMRERIALFGGDFEAGRRPEGGYALRARLPIASARA